MCQSDRATFKVVHWSEREREIDRLTERETDRGRESFLPNWTTSYNRGREGERNKALRQGRVG